MLVRLLVVQFFINIISAKSTIAAIAAVITDVAITTQGIAITGMVIDMDTVTMDIVITTDITAITVIASAGVAGKSSS